MTILCGFLAVSWLLAISITLWGTWLAVRHLTTPPPHLDAPFRLYPISVLKPLKGAEPGIRENLASFFELDYPRYEILFSVADERDPVLPVVRGLIERNPDIPARIIVGDVKAGPNPKVNNLVHSYQQAKYDWLVISDSNVRVMPDYLKRLAAHLDNGVGIMTSVVCGQDPHHLGGHLEAAYLSTFYARGMAIAFAMGQPTVLGKSMMFRKSVAERFGGIQVLARYLAEDYIAGEAFRYLGMRVVLAADPVRQYIGKYSFKSFWSRHTRWGRIRKVQSPIVFFLELWMSCMVSGAIGAVALHAWLGVAYPVFIALHLMIWSACDFSLMRRMGHAMSFKTPGAWFLRELLWIPLWFHVVSGNTVEWRGRTLRLQPGGILEFETHP